MRAHRALALLATAGAMLFATASIVLVGPGVAVAAPAPAPNPQGGAPAPQVGNPQSAYPLPPPSLVTNRGRVKVGQKVRIFGNHFGYVERVVVTITANQVSRRLTLTTDRYGRFRTSIPLTAPGRVTITAVGSTSHLSASVTVTVVTRSPQQGPPPPPPARTAPTTPLVVFNPLIAENSTLGLGSGGVAGGSATDSAASLVANSDDVTPASSQFPLGAVGGVAALLGIALLVVLSRKRRRPSAEN
ncbi:MAG TPA: hypothetical protein VJT31_22275 [Rugosimonospora sp.]|nr:hypothetical protein [Rugosimonospora sp.]